MKDSTNVNETNVCSLFLHYYMRPGKNLIVIPENLIWVFYLYKFSQRQTKQNSMYAIYIQKGCRRKSTDLFKPVCQSVSNWKFVKIIETLYAKTLSRKKKANKKKHVQLVYEFPPLPPTPPLHLPHGYLCKNKYLVLDQSLLWCKNCTVYLSAAHAKLYSSTYLFYPTDQEDRTHSIEQFRSAEKDVLVATDVASKGLDFPDIKHVINYDMPEDIENYGKTTSGILNLLFTIVFWQHTRTLFTAHGFFLSFLFDVNISNIFCCCFYGAVWILMKGVPKELLIVSLLNIHVELEKKKKKKPV